MRPNRFKKLAAAYAAWAACALLTGCSKPADQGYDPEKVITLAQGRIVVEQSSPFLKHLELTRLDAAPQKQEPFKVVGQIVALANSSDELTGSGILWSELDPALTRSLGLDLKAQKGVSVGQAYGVAELPAAYAGPLAAGDPVSVARYGLRKFGTSARVVSVQASPDDEGWVRALFKIPAGDEWYPGNNCEAAFPMLRGHPIAVPTTALLHEGSQEYLLQATGPGTYKPLRIVILDTLDLGRSALVIGAIPPRAMIVSRGAILLKPFLHRVLRAQAGSSPEEAAP